MRSTSPVAVRSEARDKSADAFDNLKSKIAGLALKPAKEPRRRPLPGEPDLVPIFPILYLTPKSECPHRGPLPRGTRCCCVVCSKSGLDHLAVLSRTPATDPKPEKKPPPPPAKKLTRKEARALQREWSPRASTLTAEEQRYLREQGVAI